MEELLLWSLYNVVLPLLSIGFVVLIGWLKETSKPLFDILKDGQLCFYATVILSSLLFDIFQKQGTPSLLFSSVLILTLLTMLVYGFALSNDGIMSRNSVWRMGLTSTTIGIAAVLTVLGTRLKLGLF